MKDCQVYLHVKLTNGEPFYVGRGKIGRSESTASRSKRWWNVVNKYGRDIIILEDNLSEEESTELEKYWISRIGRKDKRTGTLVNMTSGEDYSDTRNKMISKSLKGRTHRHSEETKKKIGESHRGMKRSLETCEKISLSKKGKSVPRSIEYREKMKLKKWFNNGEKNIRLSDEEVVPLGFTLGRLVPKTIIRKTCLYCEKEFIARAKSSKFCSVSCGLKNRYKNASS